MLSYEEIKNQTIFVAKMIGYRTTGTLAEIGYLAELEECRDFDTVCWEGQPEHLQDFYKAYEEQVTKKDGCFFIEDFYNKVWKPEQEQKEQQKQSRRTWTEEEIKNLVQTNDKVLYGALKKLYACQTEDEKEIGETSHSNGVGFNYYDAPILTSMAEFLIKTGFLTPKQKDLCRKKLKKYNRQITMLANA